MDLIVEYNEEDDMYVRLKPDKERLKGWKESILNHYFWHYNLSEGFGEFDKGFFIPRIAYEKVGKIDYDLPPGIMEYYYEVIGIKYPHFRLIGRTFPGQKAVMKYGVTVKYPEFDEFLDEVEEYVQDEFSHDIVICLINQEMGEIEECYPDINNWKHDCIRTYCKQTQLEKFLEEIEFACQISHNRIRFLKGKEAKELFKEYYEKYGIVNEAVMEKD